MRRNLAQSWQLVALSLALLACLAIGLIFGIIGNPLSPFTPFPFWREYPQNDYFLWISAITFVASTILSYSAWPLVERERKKGVIERRPSFLQYGETTMRQVNWLVWMVFWPALALYWIFSDLAAITHLVLLLWLGVVSLLLSIVADIVAVGLMITGRIKQGREARAERNNAAS